MEIENCIKELKEQIKEDKEFLWNHPENGNEEFITSKYISDRLKQIGCDVKENIAITGVLATITGEKEGPCILFRSELDALKMDNTGRMKHTCGHDAHMTIMLALAKLVMDRRNELKGTVKFIFEPAEETTGGAKYVIEEGILENPHVDYVFGVHVWSELKKGTFAIKPGAIMASTDPFNITVYGKAGHGALPEKCVDPIYIASSIVTSLQSIVGRNISPNETATIAITAINGGSTNNRIPEKVEMKGLCRTFNNEIRDYIKIRINEISSNLAEAMGGKCTVEFKSDSYPAVVNDSSVTEMIEEIAINTVGKENIISDYKTMCSDDFAYFLQNRPGTFIFAGCTGEEYYAQHSENFFVDTETIVNTVQFMYEIVKKFSF